MAQLFGNIIFQKVILSLAIGALIGIEREWRAKGGREIFAGVRTFMLVCLFGVLTPYTSELVFSPWPIYIGFAAVVGAMLIGYYINFKKFGAIGLTTEIAFILTYLIGMFLFFESAPYFVSIALGIILTLILYSRESLHGFAHKRTRKEVRDAVVFAAIVFIVLPLLPKQPIDPYGAINPYFVWLSMIIVMSVSFAGYIAMELWGEGRGLGMTGFFGGLASSTSVTISMAERSKRDKNVIDSVTFAIIVAASTMFLRMIIVVAFFNYALTFAVMPALCTLGVAGYVLSYIAWKNVKRGRATIKFASPISFKPILQFMVIFIIVLFASHMAKLYFPSAMYLIAALSGVFDVDAITISLASLSQGLATGTAVNGIIIAALSNTFSKMLLARWIGGKKVGKEVAKVFVPLLVVGIILFSFYFFSV